MMTIVIAPATLRDCTFVAAHMRDCDWAEIGCQMPDGSERSQAGAWCWSVAALSWAAAIGGSPVMAFGVAPMSPAGHVVSAWAYGTARMRRAVPAVTAFCLREVEPLLRSLGVRRIEARVLDGHGPALRWLTGMGATVEGRCRGFGKAGEDFHLVAKVLG